MKWDYREPDETRRFPGNPAKAEEDEIEKFLNNLKHLTPEEHRIINEHFWELLSKPLPDSITQDDGPFFMGKVE